MGSFFDILLQIFLLALSVSLCFLWLPFFTYWCVWWCCTGFGGCFFVFLVFQINFSWSIFKFISSSTTPILLTSVVIFHFDYCTFQLDFKLVQLTFSIGAIIIKLSLVLLNIFGISSTSRPPQRPFLLTFFFSCACITLPVFLWVSHFCKLENHIAANLDSESPSSQRWLLRVFFSFLNLSCLIPCTA